MIVLCITGCPPRLRGDLSKWLLEINTGVYIGRLSTRVREEVWRRVCDNIREGQATMIYPSASAQGYSIAIHHAPWEPVDYDGLTLMRRPLPARRVQPAPAPSASAHRDAAGSRAAEAAAGMPALTPVGARVAAERRRDAAAARTGQHHGVMPAGACTIVDIETTGLDCTRDVIIEVAAVRVEDGRVTGEYQCLVRQQAAVPELVVKLTGITDDMLQAQGVEEREALAGLLAFMGKTRIVGYNIKFDMGFIAAACARQGLERSVMKTSDVLWMARRKIGGLDNYRMESVARHLFGEVSIRHRALDDCRMISRIYGKLNEIEDGG